MSKQNLTEEHKVKLLTIQDLCILFGVKESKLRSMIFKKEIPYLKMGRLVRFSEKDIDDWLEQIKRN